MEDIYEEINSDREKELQMSFEVLINFSTTDQMKVLLTIKFGEI